MQLSGIKNISVFVISLLITNITFAQDTLTFRVMDQKYKTPVVFAFIESGNIVKTYSDTLGYCRIPSSDLKEKVSVKCLGYADYSFPVAEMPKSGIIYLNPKEISLTEVAITSKKTVSADYIKQSHTHLLGAQLSYSCEECTFVPLPSGGAKKIVTVKIKMSQGKVENPVRLHLYSVNESGLPGQDLLDSNVIIYNRDVQEGEYMLTVADKNIKVVGDKVFVGVEWPGLYQIRKEEADQIGPKVRIAESIEEPRTFIRNAKSPKWQAVPIYDKRPANMLVSVDYLSVD